MPRPTAIASRGGTRPRETTLRRAEERRGEDGGCLHEQMRRLVVLSGHVSESDSGHGRKSCYLILLVYKECVQQRELYCSELVLQNTGSTEVEFKTTAVDCVRLAASQQVAYEQSPTMSTPRHSSISG